MESPDAATPTKNARVCIIGAGVSGLRCADVLLQHGVSVTILEARDRIGGRVHRSDQLGYTADIGPNWIHTSGHNPLLQLAKQTDTPLHVWNERIRVYDRAGSEIPEDQAKHLSELRWTLIEEAFPYSLENKANIPASDSLYDFLLRRTNEEKLAPDERQLLLDMSQMWGCYVGDPIQRQSLRFAFLEDCCGGEESVVASSFNAILDKIAAPALEKAEIRLEQKVVGFTNHPSQPRQVTVTTGSGEKFQYDAVVVTTPLGWLKKNAGTAFEPSLSPSLTKAISAISVGHLEKVYIHFPRAFWRCDAALGPQDDSSETSEDKYPGYTNWIAPTYASESNPNQWPQEAYDLGAFAAPYSRATLLWYTYGDCSAYITSNVHDKPCSAQHDFLKSFFEPYYSRLPGYDASDPTCQPKSFLATTWRFDEFSGNGSYCNFQVGIENADECVETLRKGCPERAIWFAGEHAAPEEEMGTVTGAYLSGERAAKSILAAF